MKKKYLGVLFGFALLFSLSAKVSAATTVTGDEKISDKLAEAEDNIIEVDEGEFEDTIVIDKTMTIKGAGKDKTTLIGKITVEGDVTLTLENITVKSIDDSAKIINLTNGADLTVKNSEIYYLNKEATDFGSDSVGIYTSGNSTITIDSTTIYAKYGIWAQGANNEITIKNESDINGYAALDVSNGTSGDVVNGNKVTIKDSTLTGHNIYQPEEGSYGTIVIGSQEGLELSILGSTITNSVTTDDSIEDLILISESYEASTDSRIEIVDSTLINTDDSSVIYNLGPADVVSTNIIAQENTTTKGIVYPTDGENIYVTLVTEDGDVVVVFEKDNINESLKSFLDKMSKIIEEDFVFEGYFEDDKYANSFDTEREITENTKIYMKVSLKKVETDTTPEDTEVPDTFDGITSYAFTAIISVIMVLSFGYFLKKKFDN